MDMDIVSRSLVSTDAHITELLMWQGNNAGRQTAFSLSYIAIIYILVDVATCLIGLVSSALLLAFYAF